MTEAQIAWTQKPLGKLFDRLVQGGTPSTSAPAYWNGHIPWVTGADFTSRGIGEIRRYVSDLGVRSSSTSIVEAGNILLVTRTGVGKLAIVRAPTAISQDITGVYFDRTKVDVQFAYYLLLLELESLKKLNQGTSINGIVRADLERHLVSLPTDVSAQKKIACILQTIDQAIEKTEALIDKYQQIKAGLMHDLFTRGIGPNGQLRPPRDQAPELYHESPIGWIPNEWEFAPIGKYVKSAQYGISTSLADSASGIPVLRMNNIQSNGFDVTDLKYSNDPEAYKIKLRAGDVLYNRTNSIDHVGKTAIWCNELEECSFASYLVRLNLMADLMLPEYFSHWMTQASSQDALRIYATPGVQQVNINPTNLQRVVIALPTSMEEQLEIAGKVNAVDCRVQREACLLEKLQKQKSGLMHDLLNGKLPVQAEVESETETASA